MAQYEEIARAIKAQILRGDFAANGRLPSERSLGAAFGVQRNTIRQALGVLEREGRIVTEDKRGSFIREPRARAPHRTLLFSVHRGTSPDLVRLYDGFAKVAEGAGFAVRRFDSHPRKGTATDRVPQLDKMPAESAGAALWPHSPIDAEALTRLNEALPLVLVDRRVLGVSADCVRFDDVTGARMVTDHLLDAGHRRIAFIADEVFAETVEHRWHGYVMAQESRGVAIDPRLSVFFHGTDAPYFALSIRYLFSLGKESPTAIVCSNDLVAFSLMRFLHDEGIRTPDDVAVTGYGNTMPEYTAAMSLTSVDQPFYELGEAAANILIDRSGQTTADRLREPLDLMIPVRLIVRGSSVG